MRERKRLAIVGNPNVGKTTLFNVLTGKEGKTGNWAGVTLGAEFGTWECGCQKYEVIDLPGLYSLELLRHVREDGYGALPEEERIAADFIIEGQIDYLIQVLDSDRLQRDLFLTMELLELGVPLLVVPNVKGQKWSSWKRCWRSLLRLIGRKSMDDSCSVSSTPFDIDMLREKLGCEVIAVDLQKRNCWKALQKRLCEPLTAVSEGKILSKYSAQQQDTLRNLSVIYPDTSIAERKRILMQEQEHQDKVAPSKNRDDLAAFFRAQHLHVKEIAEAVAKKTHSPEPPSVIGQALERVLLHGWVALPIFLGLMWSVFYCSTNLSNFLKPWIEGYTDLLLVEPILILLQHLHCPSVILSIWQEGVGGGMKTILSFLPMLWMLYFAMGILEDSGYMMRIAVILDQWLDKIGLSCKAVVPLIMGFGCNVPAIMAARSIVDVRQRLIAVMMMPFMSCGARLVVFVLFSSLLFSPQKATVIVVLLYLVGTYYGLLTAILLHRYFLPTAFHSNLMMLELPPYSWPALSVLWAKGYRAMRNFIRDTAAVIMISSVVLCGLGAVNWRGDFVAPDDSALADVSRSKIVLNTFQPMGIESKNWPAALGLIAGMMAKEVIIANVFAMYQMEGDAVRVNETMSWGGWWQKLLNYSVASEDALSDVAAQRALVQQYFTSAEAVFAYLLFVLLYFPCVSVFSAIRMQFNRGYALLSALWNTGLAYCIAVLFFQLSRYMSFGLALSGTLVISTVILWVVCVGFYRKFGGLRAVIVK